MHDVDDRIGGDVTTAFGTCKLVESKGPHEFHAFAERFRRQYGRGALSLYGGAAKTVEHLKQRMKAHLRELNDLGVQAYKKLVMVAIRVHDMGGLVADGKQHGEDEGIEEAWIQANLSACQGVEAINQRRGGSGSYPADDESIILYVVYSPEPPSTARPRCLMKQAMLKGIHVPNGSARDPWDLEELRCVERHGPRRALHGRARLDGLRRGTRGAGLRGRRAPARKVLAPSTRRSLRTGSLVDLHRRMRVG